LEGVADITDIPDGGAAEALGSSGQSFLLS